MNHTRISLPVRRMLAALCAVLLWAALVAGLRRAGVPLLSLDEALRHPTWQLLHFLRLPVTLGFVGLTLWQAWRQKPGSRAVWVTLLVFTLICCRWNTLSGYEHNGDESESIIAARTLLVDSRFWISVDVGTHGPLVSLWQTLLPGFGLAIDYASSRLLGIAMLSVCVLCGFSLLRRIASEAHARLLTVPLTLAVASFAFTDLTAYNGEHPIMLLVMLGAAAAACAFLPPLQAEGAAATPASRHLPLLLGAGVCTGSVGWAKNQGVPLAAALAAIVIVACLRAPAPSGYRWRRLLVFGAGLAAPSLAVLGWVLASGAFEPMVRSYFQWNLAYATRFKDAQPQATLHYGSWALRTFLSLSRFVTVFLGGALIGWVVFGWRMLGRRQPVSGPQKALLAAAALTSAAAWFCVIRPGNEFAHYTLLAVFPTLLLHLMAWAALLGSEASVPRIAGLPRPTLGFAVTVLALPLGVWGFAGGGNGGGGQLLRGFDVSATPPRHELVKQIRRLAGPRDRIAIWGWMPAVYVQSERPKTPRVGANLREALPVMPMQPYFLDLYLRDWDRRPPRVFVDGFGVAPPQRPGAARTPAPLGTMEWFYETTVRRMPNRPSSVPLYWDAGFGHEQYPALARRVRADYRLQLTTADGSRVYVRNDRRD